MSLQDDLKTIKMEEIEEFSDFLNRSIEGKSLQDVVTGTVERVIIAGALNMFSKDIANRGDAAYILSKAIFLGIVLAEAGRTHCIMTPEVH